MIRGNKRYHDEIQQRSLLQQRIVMRFFLTIFIPVFSFLTVQDFFQYNQAELMANAAITILMFGILATRFIDMSPVTEYRLTSLLNILLVIILCGVVIYMIAVKGYVNRYPWTFLVIVFAVYALPAPAGSIISVAFVAIVAYLVVRYVPQPLSADAIFGFKVRYLSALGLSLFVAIVAISVLRKTIADLV